MTTLEKITQKIDEETKGMTADERFHYYRQLELRRRADLGLRQKGC